MISFHCPRCKYHVQRPVTDAGQKIACPGCTQRLLIPQPKNQPLPVDAPTMMGELILPKSTLPPSPPPALLQPTVLSGPPLRCSCPHCQATFNVDPQHAGMRHPCPVCKLPFEIPMPKAKLVDEAPAQAAVMPVVARLSGDSSVEIDLRSKRGKSSAVADGVNAPAILMIVFGFVSLFVAVAGTIFSATIMEFASNLQVDNPNYSAAEIAQWKKDKEERINICSAGLMSGLVGGLIALIVIAGGFAMKLQRAYWLAIIATLLLVVPNCSCCSLGMPLSVAGGTRNNPERSTMSLGSLLFSFGAIPIGLWGLIVLNRREVKDGFQQPRRS